MYIYVYISARRLHKICHARVRIWAGHEYRRYDLFNGITITSNSSSVGVTRWNTKELGIFFLGRYSVYGFNEFDISDARSCPIEGKYLLKIFGNSEVLDDIILVMYF